MLEQRQSDISKSVILTRETIEPDLDVAQVTVCFNDLDLVRKEYTE